ncbi:MAG: hypothetical protein ABI675_09225 [Chitinophagaceae bacterium]
MRYKFLPFIGCFLIFFLVTLNYSSAQNFPNRVTAPLSSNSAAEEDDDLQAKFIRQEWSPGIVQFKSTRPVMQVPVIFDAENNMLYYLENNTIMEFVDSISGFMMKVVKNNDSTFITFRNAYPSIQSNTGHTFYEVLVDGNIQLLKCRAKSIYRFKEPDILDKKKPVHKELLFAYLPGGKMTVVKKDIDVLVEKMPEYAQLIKEIEKKHNLKLKNEKKLCELFAYLNKPE